MPAPDASVPLGSWLLIRRAPGTGLLPVPSEVGGRAGLPRDSCVQLFPARAQRDQVGSQQVARLGRVESKETSERCGSGTSFFAFKRVCLITSILLYICQILPTSGNRMEEARGGKASPEQSGRDRWRSRAGQAGGPDAAGVVRADIRTSAKCGNMGPVRAKKCRCAVEGWAGVTCVSRLPPLGTGAGACKQRETPLTYRLPLRASLCHLGVFTSSDGFSGVASSQGKL